MIAALEPLFHTPSELAVSARQLTLEVVPLEWAAQLNFEWHSQLPETGGFQFGDLKVGHALVFDGGVYAVAMWSRPVAANRIAHPTEHLVELRRLAIPPYAPKFTATRSLGLMERWFKTRHPALCRLLSYQMTDVHTGTIYKAANWHVARVQTDHQTWTTHTKRKAVDQSTAPKVRWERQLRTCEEVEQ